MDDEIELIVDGDGMAVIGSSSAVEEFLGSLGLSITTDDAPTLGRALALGGVGAQVGSNLASQSGRWVKLTAESAEKMKQINLTPTTTPGVSHAMLGPRGSIKSWLQIDTTATARLTNPATLSGIAGMMTQLALQQQMEQIAAYLERIDQKLDSVLRTQINQVLARLDGVALAAREAMSIRSAVGRVSDVVWSKVQASAQTIHEVQGFAVRQLGDVAQSISAKKIDQLLDQVEAAEADVTKWLQVLARCFELHDAVGVLELDRVLDAAPEEIDQHRLGLQVARRDRVEAISTMTTRLVERLADAIEQANSKVLFNPVQSPTVVDAGTRMLMRVMEFRELLELATDLDSVDSRRWKDAAAERLSSARESGSAGVSAAKRVGAESLGAARSVSSRITKKISTNRGTADDDQTDVAAD